MMDVRSLHKYMELDQINSISVSTGDIQVLVLSSKFPGIYFRSCDESSFTATKKHGDALAFTQRIPFWNSELRKGRPSLPWLWAKPLLVIALREQNVLCELNVQVSSGSARIAGIDVRKLGCKVSAGSLRIQYSSCEFATFSITNSSIISKSLKVEEECSVSASSSRIVLTDSFQPENGYQIRSNNGSLRLGAQRFPGTVVKEKTGSPLYVVESDSSRVEIL